MKEQLFFLIALIFMLILQTNLLATEAQSIKVRFEEREAFQVLGIEVSSDAGDAAYAKVFTDFIAKMDLLEYRVGDEIYGLHYPGADFNAQSMQGANYLVGMQVSEPGKVPAGMILRKAPGGNFAIFEHIGSPQTIGETYGYIFGQWIYSSGMKPSGYEMFEVYGKDYHPENPKSLIEIWVPVFSYK